MAIDYRLVVGTKIDDKDIQKQLDAMPKKKITLKATVEGSKEIKTLIDDTGKLVEVTTDYDKTGKALGSTITKTTQNVKTMSNEVKQASKHTETLGSKFVDIVKKVTAFGLATSVIGAFTKSMYEAVESVKEMDASLTELKKVSDLSGAGLQKYTEDAFAMARELSTTASNVTDAVALFVQAGYDIGEAEGLAKYSIMLQGIADKSMDAETATNFLTSTIKSMNMNASDAEHIINAVNEVSNRFSITSNDLSENIGKVAGTAKLAGVSYEQLIGLMTSAVSKGSGASKTANSLKSVFIRLQQMSTDGSLPKLQKQFEAFGLSMTDQNGAIKDAYTLLDELSVKYNEVISGTDVSKQNAMRTLVEDIGGIYNSSVLNNILSGFSTAESAMIVALDSANSAQEEFQKSLDSIEKKAEATKGALMELAWGDGGLKTLISAFLDAGTGILRFADDTKALNVVLAMTGLILLSKIVPAVISGVKSLYTFLRIITTNTVAMEAMGVAINTTKLAFGGLIAIAGIAYMVFNKIKAEQEAERQRRVENAEAINQETEMLKTSLETIKSETSSRNDIISAMASVNGEYAKELQAISDVNEVRKKAIGLINEETVAKAKQYTTENMTAYQNAMKEQSTKGKKSFWGLFSQEDVVEAEPFQSNLPKNLKFDVEALPEDQIKRLNEIIQTIQTTSGYTEEYAVLLDYAESKVSELTTAQEEQNTVMNAMNENLAVQGLKWDEATDSVVKMTDAEIKERDAKIEGERTAEDMANIAGLTAEQFEAQAEALGMSADEYAQYLDAQESSVTTAEQQAQALSDSLDATNAIISSIDELSSAFQEEAENGEISVATQLKMIEDGYALALSYDATTGACTINKEAVIALMEAKIQEQIANLQLLRTDLATKMKNDASVALTSAGAFLALANAKGSALTNLTSGKGSKTDKTQLASYDAQIKVLQGSLKSIKNVGTGAFSGIGKSAKSAGDSAKKATKGATKATKTHTDALKEQQKVLQDTVDKYEKVISYINKKVDGQIDKLEKLKDTAIDAIDAQIDALETQRDTEEEFWNDKIDALNNQNDALEDQIKLEQLLQALALAQSKKVRVFREGKGFVYESDQSAVSEAQQDLAEYTRQAKLKAQIAELESARDAKLALYDRQIADLKAYKKSVEDNYDAQIKYYEDWKDKFKEQTDAFENEQDRLLALQLTGIDFENNNWTTRINNLSSFVDKYRQYQQELANITAQINASADSADDGGGGGGGGGSSSGGGSSAPTAPTPKKINGYQGKVKYTGKYPITYNGSTYRTGQVATFRGGSPQDVASQIASFIKACGKSYASQIGGIDSYATGVASVTGDQMAITGEGKNKELVLGSKANGTLTKLDKGAGVVNAKSLKTFAGILNTIGASGITGRTSSQISNMSNSNSTTNSNSINIDNLTIQANNPKEFEGWARRMLQVSYS